MSEKSTSFSSVILRLALGIMFAVGGIWALQGGGDAACDVIRSYTNSTLETVLVIAFGVIEILSGLFLLISIFTGSRPSYIRIFLWILFIMWIIAIVLMDFLGHGGILNGGTKNFLRWLYTFASHLIVLGGIFVLI